MSTIKPETPQEMELYIRVVASALAGSAGSMPDLTFGELALVADLQGASAIEALRDRMETTEALAACEELDRATGQASACPHLPDQVSVVAGVTFCDCGTTWPREVSDG